MWQTWDNARLWSFAADMNGDGQVTISDVWLWIKWLYFYPGDGFLYLLRDSAVGRFLEITPYSFGGWLSGGTSFFAWFAAWLMFLVWLDDLSKTK